MRILATELRSNATAWARLAVPPIRALTNHGDELTELVLREAIGRRVRWSPLGREDVVAIGSILGSYLEHGGRGLIWGTGLHGPAVPRTAATALAPRVLAVRGPLAVEALDLPSTTTIGDPGLLVRGLHRRSPTARGTVLIPHFTSYRDPVQRRAVAALRAEGITVVSPTTEPTDMLRTIGAAGHVLSAGMHGIILSHALEVPATLITLRQAPAAGASFKYHDYYASVGLRPQVVHASAAVDLEDRNTLRDLALRDLVTATATIDQIVEQLLAAAGPLRSTH